MPALTRRSRLAWLLLLAGIPIPTANADRESMVSPLARKPAERPRPVAYSWGVAGVLNIKADGTGDYPTLAEAVRAARHGALIRLAPGTYREKVVVDRPVAIQGAGMPDQVVLDGGDGPCLILTTDEAEVRGVTFTGKGGRAAALVEVLRGRPVLEDCRFTAEGAGCLSVRGGGSDPLVWGCSFQGGRQAALLFAQDARGVIGYSEVQGGSVGFQVKSGALPIMRDSRIAEGAACGVLISDQGRARLDRCEISDNGINVMVTLGGAPALQGCRIRDAASVGVLVSEDGRGTLEDCEISASALSGVEISRGGNPTLRQCRIGEGGPVGVLVHTEGKGFLDACLVSKTNLSGVEVRTGGDPYLRRCTVRDGKQAGLYVHSQGRGTVEECDFTNNRGASVEIGPDCKVILDSRTKR